MSCRDRLKELLAATFVATSILCAGVAGAQAADIAPRYTKAPAAAGAAWNWSGFYVGADVGGAGQSTAAGSSNFFQNDADPRFANNLQTSPAASSNSAIGGVHLGYNWQMSHIVFGVEGDWQWMQTRQSFCRQTDFLSAACSDNGRGFLTVQGETRGIGTVRGRLGYAFDRVLVYGTGGIAFADLHGTITADCRRDGCGDDATTNLSTLDISSLKTGWVAGAGAELMLSQNWIVRAEYLHVDIGTVSGKVALAPDNCFGGPCGASWSRSQHYDIGRVGFSYKFGGTGRLVN